MAKAILALGLSTEEKQQLQGYGDELQGKLIEESGDAAKFILSLNLDGDDLTRFYSYNSETRVALVETAEANIVQNILYHALSAKDIVDLLVFAPPILEVILEEPSTRLGQFIAFGFDDVEARSLFNFSENLRQNLLDTDDQALIKSLLSLDLKEDELAAILPGITKDVKAEVDTDDLPSVDLKNHDGDDVDEQMVVSASIAELLDLSTDNGNEHIVPELYELGAGAIDETLITIGELGNTLLTDVVLADALDTDRIFDLDELVENYFYQEISILFKEWIEVEDLSSSRAFSGREVTIEPGFIELGEYFTAGNRSLYVTAAGDISLTGSVVFSSTDGLDESMERELSLLASGQFLVEEGVTLQFEEGALNLGSSRSSEFINVSMQAGGDIAIATLENLVFENSDLRVPSGDNIHLSAFNELSINGLQFSDNVREIYMQAITIDLRNIYFPDGSSVYLQSQFGGIDGIYPTFPTGDPTDLFGNRQIGRVNFIENVGYDKTTIDTRAIFDQFRDRIQITPLQ